MADFTFQILITATDGTAVKDAKVTLTAAGNKTVTLTTDVRGLVSYPWIRAGLSSYDIRASVVAKGFLPKPAGLPFDLTGQWNDTPRPLQVLLTRDPGYFSGWTYALDGETHQGIEGAAFWVNDKQTGTTQGAPNWGKVWIEGQRDVPLAIRAVKGDQYPTTIPLTIGPADSVPGVLRFTPKSPGDGFVTVCGTIPGTDVRIYSQDTLLDAHLIDAVLLGADARAITHKGFSVGQHVWVRATLAGHEPREFWLDVPANRTFTIGLLTKIEPVGPQPPVDDEIPPLPSVAPAPAAESGGPDDYEWLYPHSDDGKYFTTTQARMYIGNLFIDELNTVQFTYQQNRVPVFGYASQEVDAYGNGRRLVHGQILLNFVSEGYLFTVLAEYQRLMAQQRVRDDQVAANKAQIEALREYMAGLLAGAKRSGSPDPPEHVIAETAVLQAEIAQTLATIEQLAQETPAALDRTDTRLTSGKKLTTDKNALAVKTRFDIELTLEGGGRKVTRKLEDCVLVSNEQVYDQSGTTLLDAYGFVARRLR